MVFWESVRLAMAALAANKMRSFLTTLGIIIGVGSVVAVVSVVQGLQHLATDLFEGVGATYMIVLPQRPELPTEVGAHQVKLTWDDGKAIAALRGVLAVTPIVAGTEEVRYADRRHRPDYTVGAMDNYQEVMNHTVDRGRFFSPLDIQAQHKVAVLGGRVVDALEMGADPIGKEIYVGRLPVTVIGVMEHKGETLGQDLDDFVFLPFDEAINLFGRDAGDIVQLRLKAERTDLVEEVRTAATRLLRKRHRLAPGDPDDFQIVVQTEILKQVTGFLSGVTAVVGGIVAISLLVGGIGIMNIMLVSVTERTHEIGLRKAVGARRRDILLQFLIEATTLSVAGGIVGLAIGYGLGILVTAVVPVDLPPAHVPLWAAALAAGTSACVGIFFGLYPAARASRLDPIEALHFE